MYLYMLGHLLHSYGLDRLATYMGGMGERGGKVGEMVCRNVTVRGEVGGDGGMRGGILWCM